MSAKPKGKIMPFDEFVEKATKKHNGLYSYPECEYRGLKTTIPIYCPKHDGIFHQKAKYHLAGHGCNICRDRQWRYVRHTSHFNPSLQNIIEGEEWRDVLDFVGLYQISNYGRLRTKSNDNWVIRSNVNSKGDYLSVVLLDKNRRKSTRIHRLVFEAFVGVIPKGYYIHHIDGNKQNNHIDNLKLVSPKEHAKEHYIEMLEIRGATIDENKDSYKYIISNGQVVGENPNYDPSWAKLSLNRREGQLPNENQRIIAIHKPIMQYDLEGNFIAKFETAMEAFRETGVCARNILQVANKTPYNEKGSYRKQAGGYRWEFAS